MGYFPVRYDSRVVIYERKMFIRLATDFKVNKILMTTILQNLFRIIFILLWEQNFNVKVLYLTSAVNGGI